MVGSLAFGNKIPVGKAALAITYDLELVHKAWAFKAFP
jgi:hypothetical protein